MPPSPRRPRAPHRPRRAAPYRRGAAVIDDEAALPRRRHPRRGLDRGLQRRTRRRSRPLAGSSGKPSQELGAHSRRASTSCTWPGPRRGPRLHGAGDQHADPDLRHGPDDLEAAAAADVGAVIFELARSEQEYTFQRPGRLHHERPRRCHRGRLARAGLRPGRPLPVQCEEVRGRSGGDDRGDPARLPARDRRGLRQHRHRHARRSSTCPCRRSTTSSATNYGARPSCPRSSATLEADGVTVSVGGEIGEVGKENSTEAELRAYLDGYRRELDARGRRARSGIARSASRPARRTAACRCRTAAWPRSSSTSTSWSGSARSPGRYGLAGAVQHGASTLPDELFHHFPRSRRPRSTSRPVPERCSTTTRRSRRSSIAQIEALVLRERRRRAQARPDSAAVHLYQCASEPSESRSATLRAGASRRAWKQPSTATPLSSSAGGQCAEETRTIRTENTGWFWRHAALYPSALGLGFGVEGNDKIFALGKTATQPNRVTMVDDKGQQRFVVGRSFSRPSPSCATNMLSTGPARFRRSKRRT